MLLLLLLDEEVEVGAELALSGKFGAVPLG
jgi:hypothetical protein